MKQNNVAGFLIVLSFLATLASANTFSSSLNEELKRSAHGAAMEAKGGSSVTIQPYQLFCRKYVGGQGGIYEFLNNTDDKAQGICNVSNAKLADNTAFVFNQVSIGYTLGEEDTAATSTYATALPGELRNTEFEITQGGRVVLSMPTSSLSNPAATGNNANDQFKTLGALCYLKDSVEFTWMFKFPNGVSVDAGTAATADWANVEVVLDGYRTIKKQ